MSISSVLHDLWASNDAWKYKNTTNIYKYEGEIHDNLSLQEQTIEKLKLKKKKETETKKNWEDPTDHG